MFALNTITSAGKDRKRRGRGGSRGGTSGRGGKGQTARSGGSTRPGFEGGQMPLYRRTPKRGFNNADFALEIVIVNLDQLEATFNNGDVITKDALLERGTIKPHRRQNGTYLFQLKVLGKGTLSKKLTVHADAFSESAQKAIVSNGGEALVTKE